MGIWLPVIFSKVVGLQAKIIANKEMFNDEFISCFSQTKNLPQQVLRWQSMVESECSAQGVPELVPYVLGIIMVESGGNSETPRYYAVQ